MSFLDLVSSALLDMAIALAATTPIVSSTSAAMTMAYAATGENTVHVPVGFSKAGLGVFCKMSNAADGFTSADS